MKFTVVGTTYKVDIEGIRKVAQAAFSYLPEKTGEIEFKFVSKEEIQELNRTYRRIDAPTDVLSFNISEEPLVGQLFICYTYTRDQAKQMRKTIDAEVSLLVVHGILHIFGFDHADATTEAEMQAIEKKILQMEGIAR